MDLILEAKTPEQVILKEYLDNNATDELKMKIAISGKTLSNAWDYIYSQARKLLNGRSGAIKDDIVFAWLIHYFEDEVFMEQEKTIKEEKTPIATVKPKTKATTPKVESQAKVESKTQLKMEVKKNEQTNKGYVQITLNDLFDL